MGIDKKTFTHICNAIRRQVQAQFPDLTLIFIVHEEDGREAAINREARNILSHPAGQNIIDFIRNGSKKAMTDKRTKLIGLSDRYAPGIFGLMSKHQILATFFINSSRFETEDMLRNHALHLAWHALAMREDYLNREGKTHKPKGKNAVLAEETYEIKDKVIKPKLTIEKLYQRNLMADIFSASLQYLDGHPHAIRSIAAQRMKDTLIQRTGFIAERYPYPVSLDTLDFIFEHRKAKRRYRLKSLADAISITKEIGEKYSIPAIKQWKKFAHPAQHMAWLGYKPEVILGAAIYTSENPYVRSIADRVVDITEIEPDIVTNIDDFNPFLGLESNQKIHIKSCNDTLRKLLLELSETGQHTSFYEEAQKQNQRLCQGNPYGWCASSLIALGDKYRTEVMKSYSRDEKSKAETVFEVEQAKIPYEILLRFSALIFQRRREGNILNLEDIAYLAGSQVDFEPIRMALEKTKG
jgi:hypothetical protein